MPDAEDFKHDRIYACEAKLKYKKVHRIFGAVEYGDVTTFKHRCCTFSEKREVGRKALGSSDQFFFYAKIEDGAKGSEKRSCGTWSSMKSKTALEHDEMRLPAVEVGR